MDRSERVAAEELLQPVSTVLVLSLDISSVLSPAQADPSASATSQSRVVLRAGGGDNHGDVATDSDACVGIAHMAVHSDGGGAREIVIAAL